MSDKVIHMMNLSPKSSISAKAAADRRSREEILRSADRSLEERVQFLETFARVMAMRLIHNGKEMNEDGEAVASMFTMP